MIDIFCILIGVLTGGCKHLLKLIKLHILDLLLLSQCKRVFKRLGSTLKVQHTPHFATIILLLRAHFYLSFDLWNYRAPSLFN